MLKNFQFLFLILLIFISCAPDDGDGFLTAHNVCIWDETYYQESVSSTNANEPLFDDSASKYLASSFTLPAENEFWGVALKISKTSLSPTSGFYVEIVEDLSGKPSENLVMGASGTIYYSKISTSAEWVDFQFEEVPILEANTTYWLKLTPYYNESGTKHVIWHYNSGGSGFHRSSDGTSWGSSIGEAAFKFLPCK